MTWCADCIHRMVCYRVDSEPRDYSWRCGDFEAEKVGHWIVHPKGIYAHLVCDRCLSGAPYDCKTNYCPNCGARMEDENE
jgi:hypothetical protein